ncbi:hypothetical protein C4J97_3661 [Pseudomonas orientalis]|nr:hypothetical protein C4J97_3661 [Pseudomonas orientalis]
MGGGLLAMAACQPTVTHLIHLGLNVGGGLPPKTSAQQTVMLVDPPLSGASPLPHLIFAASSMSFA